MAPSIYEQLGGREAIAAVVDRFYERVLDDKQLAGYFEDVEMDELREHQTMFLSHVAGGPVEYEGESIRDAHEGLGITETDFQRVAGHLDDTLAEFDVPEPAAEAVMSEVGALESDVVGH